MRADFRRKRDNFVSPKVGIDLGKLRLDDVVVAAAATDQTAAAGRALPVSCDRGCCCTGLASAAA